MIYTSAQLLVQNIIVDCNIDRNKYPNAAFLTANGLCIYEFDEARGDDITDPNSDFSGETVVDQHRAIPGNYDTGYTSNNEGETYTFSHARLRVNLYSGSSVSVSMADLDEDTYADLSTLTPTDDGLTINPKKRFTLPIGNKVAEQVSFRLAIVGAAMINQFIAFVAPKEQDYPR